MPRYTVEKLTARIQEGIGIFQEQLGVTPSVFRAPCGAISKPMFEALLQAGIRFSNLRGKRLEAPADLGRVAPRGSFLNESLLDHIGDDARTHGCWQDRSHKKDNRFHVSWNRPISAALRTALCMVQTENQQPMLSLAIAPRVKQCLRKFA